jgi:uncharacterized membrane protein
MSSTIGRDAVRLKHARAILASIPGWLWWGYGGAAVLYTVMPVVMYLFYRQPSFDLGIYDQTIWLLAHGETFNTVAGIHVFGAHFSPILYLLTPLAFIPGGAVPELVFEGLWMATAVFPIWKIATFLDRSPKPLVLLGVIHPGVFTAAWWGMRPWNLTYPVVLWAAYAILKRPHWTTITAFGIIGLTFREDIAFWIGIIALILALARKVEWRHVLIAGVPLAALTAIIIFGLMPQWSPTNTYLYQDTLTVSGSETQGAQFLMLKALLRASYLALPVALSFPRVSRSTGIQMLPLLLPLVPVTRRDNSLPFSYHYELLFVVGVVLIAALSASQLRPVRIVLGVLVGASLLGALNPYTRFYGANPFGMSSDRFERYSAVYELVRSDLEDGRPASLPDPLVSHFSERAQVFRFPYPFDAPLREPYQMICPPPRLVVADLHLEHLAPTWQAVRPAYRFTASSDRFAIFTQDSAPGEQCQYPR